MQEENKAFIVLNLISSSRKSSSTTSDHTGTTPTVFLSNTTHTAFFISLVLAARLVLLAA
jgi:hypothetical protein